MRRVRSGLHEVTRLGGTIKQRELPRYERGAFEQTLIAPQGRALAAFVCPGHALLDATIDVTLERHRGAVLVDERNRGLQPRVLFYLEQAILTRSEARRVVSKRILYAEIDGAGTTRPLKYAPLTRL